MIETPSRRSVLTAAGAGLLGAALLPPSRARAATEDPREHFFDVEGAFNIRDIGWYTNRQGRAIKRGQIWRGSYLAHVTDTGLSQLATLGLLWDVNLLSNRELAGGRVDRLPPGVQLFTAPIGDDAANPMPPEIDTDNPDPYVLSEFREYVTSAQARQSLGATLRKIASSGSTPLFVHCNSGTYRTGYLIALLMHLLDVPRAKIDEEFLLSNLTFGVTYAWTDYLDAAVEQARTSFGSVRAYLRTGLGINAPTVAALRSRLLT